MRKIITKLVIGIVLIMVLASPIILVVSADIQNSTYNQSYDISTQEPNPRGVTFNDDGSKMYVVGDNKAAYEYDLSTPYDISTASYTQSVNVNGDQGITFNDDGSLMFVLTGGTVYEYTLTTPFDISTASYTEFLDVSSQDTGTNGITFNNDGTKMFIIGNSNDKVYEYVLTTPFDITTATYDKSVAVKTEALTDVRFNKDGSKMFISGVSSDNVYEYDLTTPFDVSTATLNTEFDVSAQSGGPQGIEFNNDGTKMYVADWGNGAIYSYNTDISGFESEYKVSGVVKDNSNNVMSGASVEAINSSGVVIASDTTNTKGEYSLNVTSGEYKFVSNADSYEPTSKTANVTGNMIIDFSLEPLLVSGYVKDSTNTGVADATVEFRDGFGVVVKSDTTNATGFYEVQIANGTYEINATKSSYTSDNVTYNVAGSGTVNDLVIESQSDVTGYVTDLSGNKVGNANVTLYENDVKIESKLTNRNGKFKFNTTNGDYKIEVAKNLYAPYSENFSVSGDTDLGKIRIEKKDYDLTLAMSKYMNYSDIQEIVVRFNNDDVTSNSTITITDTYTNYELITYYANNHSLVATHNESLYGEINVNASYDAGDKIVYVDENVTVSPVEMKHVEILSPLFATLSIVGNQRMQYIFFVIIVGVGATIITTRSGGMGLMIISLIGGWLAGFIGLGVVLASLFAGIFIMMNTQDTLRYGGG